MKKEADAKAFANLSKEEKIKQNKLKCLSMAQVTVVSSAKKERHIIPCIGCSTKPIVLPASGFPYPQLTKELGETIIQEWCKETKLSSLEELGCAVCGELVPISQLSHLKAIKKMLGILEAPNATQIECKSASHKISGFKSPVLDYWCDKVCDNCRKNIRKGRVPCLALAINLWLGEVPKVLSELNYVVSCCLDPSQLLFCQGSFKWP